MTYLARLRMMLIFVVGVAIFAATAVAMTVQPVIVDLSTTGSRTSQVVTVENSFTTPLPIELRATEADFKDGALVASTREAKDLLIFPPQAIVPPGRSQSFRIQWIGDPDIKTSRHFFLTVAQLPVKLPAGQSAVQILYNFQVIVSVAAPGAKSAIEVKSAEAVKGVDGKVRLLLNLRNQSNTYGYLSEGTLKISQKDRQGKEVFKKSMNSAEIQQQFGYGLVGAGQVRKLQTPLELPLDGGSVEAVYTSKSRR